MINFCFVCFLGETGDLDDEANGRASSIWETERARSGAIAIAAKSEFFQDFIQTMRSPSYHTPRTERTSSENCTRHARLPTEGCVYPAVETEYQCVQSERRERESR